MRVDIEWELILGKQSTFSLGIYLLLSLLPAEVRFEIKSLDFYRQFLLERNCFWGSWDAWIEGKGCYQPKGHTKMASFLITPFRFYPANLFVWS